MEKVIAGRPINGITINGLEWLLTDDGEVMIFDSEEQATEFLKDHGVTDGALESVVFVHSIGTCRRCGSPLFPSQIEGYTSQCFTCDEDFFGIEQDAVDRFEDLMSEELGIDRKILFGEGTEVAKGEES